MLVGVVNIVTKAFRQTSYTKRSNIGTWPHRGILGLHIVMMYTEYMKHSDVDRVHARSISACNVLLTVRTRTVITTPARYAHAH